jgi:outer membrane lipoprotein-sorting protein
VREGFRLALVGFLAVTFLSLSGCISIRRHLPVPKEPSVVQTVTADDLVREINQRWDAMKTLYATVEIKASKLKTAEGVETDYTTFPGIIMMRKPEMLRVYGRVPVIGTQMFSMASDGKNFTLYIPSKSLAYKGPNELTKKSANSIENMRPGFFFDAMVLRGLEPDDFYARIADTETIEDAAKKHLYNVPEYVLSITRHNNGSRNDTPVRVVTFHREDLLPYQQDLYDKKGNLETQVFYANYTDFGGGNRYPRLVTIKRPLEGVQLVLTVEKVVQNMPLTDDQFQIKLPEGTKIQELQ